MIAGIGRLYENQVSPLDFYSTSFVFIRFPHISGFTVFNFIDNKQFIKKILKHLSLWDVKLKFHPRANDPPTETFIIYDESSSPGPDDYLIDADYPIEMETYLYKIAIQLQANR